MRRKTEAQTSTNERANADKKVMRRKRLPAGSSYMWQLCYRALAVWF